MKVLVAIDGSERSHHALRFISTLLKPEADSLLLYFSPPAFRLVSKTELTADVLDNATEALATAIFDRAKQHLAPEMQAVTGTIRGETKPAQGILAAAENEYADLIVMGARGTVKTLSFFLGGTARNVAHHAKKPVLIVRGEDDLDPESLKVLVTCDDEQRWQDSVPLVRRLTWPAATKTTLFHVVESFDDEHVRALLESSSAVPAHSRKLVHEYKQRIESEKADCAQRLSELQKDAPLLLKNAEVEVAQGHAVEQIMAKIERDKPDLVLVGARRLGPLGRLLGSTTETLLVRANCSILVVHEHAPT